MAATKTVKTLRKPVFMKHMSEERQGIVDTWLLREDSIDKLATKIQNEWKLCNDIQHASLVKSITRYKQNRIVPKQAQIATRLGSPEHVSRLAALETKLENVLNPVQAMENMIAKQLARVQKMEATEARMPTLMDVQTKNMNLLWGMLREFTVLQMNMGLIRRAPKKDTQSSLTREQLEYAQSLKKGDVPAEATLAALSFLEDVSAIDCKTLNEEMLGRISGLSIETETEYEDDEE